MTALISGSFSGCTPALVAGVPLPDVNDLRDWLTIVSTSPEVDAVLEEMIAVSAERILSRCVTFVDEAGEPVDLVPSVIRQAVLMNAARWYRRRNSVSGFEGYADVGWVRVAIVDTDIEQMVERWLGHDFA